MCMFFHLSRQLPPNVGYLPLACSSYEGPQGAEHATAAAGLRGHWSAAVCRRWLLREKREPAVLLSDGCDAVRCFFRCDDNERYSAVTKRETSNPCCCSSLVAGRLGYTPSRPSLDARHTKLLAQMRVFASKRQQKQAQGRIHSSGVVPSAALRLSCFKVLLLSQHVAS